MRSASSIAGSRATREREFRCIVHHVKRDKEGFIRRLQGRVKTHSDGCITYRGTKHKSGYPRLNFRYKGKHMSITAARVFLILMLARPIQLAHDAGHGCNRRTCVRHLFEQHYSENCITV